MPSRVTAIGIVTLAAVALAARSGHTQPQAIPIPEGQQVLADSLAISQDGRYVVFATLGGERLGFLFDRIAGVVEPLLPDLPPGLPLERAVIAGPGRFVVFSSSREDLLPRDSDELCEPPTEDCNGASDVFRLDRWSGGVDRLSLTCFHEESAGACHGVASGWGGDTVAMTCSGSDLVHDDHNGLVDVFLRHEARDYTYRVSVPDIGGEADAPSGWGAVGPASAGATVSQDGRFVVFVSGADNLVLGDENGALDVFVHDIDRGRTERVSLAWDGAELDADSGLTGVSTSADARLIVFDSAATQAHLGDVSAGRDVLLRDRLADTTELASPRLADCAALGGEVASDTGDAWAPEISADGRFVGYLSDSPCLVPGVGDGLAHAYIWSPLDGVARLVDRAETGTPANGPAVALRLSANASWAVVLSEATDFGTGDDSPLPRLVLARALPDRDGDGLMDTWEEEGLDVDGDGLPELDLPSLGASPDRRDLFVEADYLQAADHSHRLSATVIEWLVTSFAEAPLDNPDGSTGVTLHLDGQGAEAIVETPANRELDGLFDVDVIKAQWFGTAAERSQPDWEAVRPARLAVYRYGLMAHRLERTSSSGLSELPGDDFVVTLGAFTDQVGTLDEQAGTYLHELGHSLGLLHGGLDNINCKPNYLSVMSYVYQFSDLVEGRPLDLSRSPLLTLNTEDLSEPAGIGGPAGWTMAYGPPYRDESGLRVPHLAPADGPIDWNVDGDAGDEAVAANIRYVASFCFGSSGGPILRGHDDWRALAYNFRGSGDVAPGRHVTPVVRELTVEDADLLRQMAPYGLDQPPVARIRVPARVREGGRLLLDGRGSYDPEGGRVDGRWVQVAGPPMTLTTPDELVSEAVAPRVTADTTVEIELAVHDARSWSAPRFATVVIVEGEAGVAAGPPDPQGPPEVVHTDTGPALSLGGPILDLDVDQQRPEEAAANATELQAEAGCACRAAGGSTTNAPWLLLLGWLLKRRRPRPPRRL